MLEASVLKTVLAAQKSEINEHFVYRKLAQWVRGEENRKVLEKIAADELGHHNFWKSQSEQNVVPDVWAILKYVWIAKIFGITFGLKLMENDEGKAQKVYDKLAAAIPQAKEIEKDEAEHERLILNMLKESRLEYIGSAVLGLNDALVELTGALAGFTFALRQGSLVAAAGLITGIAAALSMASSEYLSTKAEAQGKNALFACLYTGTTYLVTVIILILPFLLLKNPFISLGISLCSVVIIIFAFTFYISVAKDLPFKKRVIEMLCISLGVATLSFGIGVLVRHFLGIDV